jgi:hypothetical protein
MKSRFTAERCDTVVSPYSGGGMFRDISKESPFRSTREWIGMKGFEVGLLMGFAAVVGGETKMYILTHLSCCHFNVIESLTAGVSPASFFTLKNMVLTPCPALSGILGAVE